MITYGMLKDHSKKKSPAIDLDGLQMGGEVVVHVIVRTWMLRGIGHSKDYSTAVEIFKKKNDRLSSANC